MPEGHVLHRAARLQGGRFNGHRLAASSPQGRFAQGAARLDGQLLDGIDAKGKHIFYRFDSGDVLHVHLGLYGKFRLDDPPFPEPSPNARLVLSTDRHRLHLAGPTACELLSTDEASAVADRLGPDPLLAPTDGGSQITDRLKRRTIPIGAAIVDQKVIAGLGNVYRAELLFLVRLHPFVKANQVPPELIDALWQLSISRLRVGERSGRIATVDPEEVGAPSAAALDDEHRLYAYKRDGLPCRRCDDLIRSADIDGRSIWWCPTCQPAS
ncbi:MAG: Fpg/Nei family DNA glycosylase [Acidimicrobiales bacterium]